MARSSTRGPVQIEGRCGDRPGGSTDANSLYRDSCSDGWAARSYSVVGRRTRFVVGATEGTWRSRRRRHQPGAAVRRGLRRLFRECSSARGAGTKGADPRVVCHRPRRHRPRGGRIFQSRGPSGDYGPWPRQGGDHGIGPDRPRTGLPLFTGHTWQHRGHCPRGLM